MLQDQVLKDSWFAVMVADNLGNKPVPIEIMGERVALFRTEKGVHAFKDLCIHRGAALSGGWVKNGVLVCPYHGWEYDCSGQCVRIPSQPKEQAITQKAKAIVYECQERYGLIWVSLGQPSSSPPPYPEYSDPAFRTIISGPNYVNGAFTRVVENFLDVGHLAWIHDGLLGSSEYPEVKEYKVHFRDGRYISDPIYVYQPDPDGRGQSINNGIVYEILSPFTARLTKTDPNTGIIKINWIHAVPVSARKTLMFSLVARNYDLDASNDTFLEFQNTINQQDAAMIETQRPEELPLDLQTELHLKSDRLAIAYRRWLTELGVTVGTA
ncbi:aromatic ring-hydroxylating dioxygenase subunit alpha [Bacillus sp. B15-48]|uniref:aromatic ring-hydroxylating oxygenase subunit alpha n=1 Tax=Bacillus sp. B15-48 TaxID=1548601 RepID=UPI00193F0FBF|nr:aromatic ring-hydroxylating dioxygenase subunit alpha [Bacillus sp. B15-48]MBM4764867.1 Rieske 2Fe-2S domain-containing protein [Bacillus sp. B15-48]